MQYLLAGLDYLDDAIEIATQAVALREPGWDRASGLLALAALHRRAGHLTEAHQVLRDCAEIMPTDPSSEGLWRHFVKERFLLVPVAPDQDTARALLHEADQHLSDLTRLWMGGVLDAAIAAADHVGQFQARYRSLAQTARWERDEEFHRTCPTKTSTPDTD